MAEIELRNLGFTYPGAASATLSDLSLTVANGAAHALLGGSGTGKTTILNLMSGLLRPTQGSVLFDGVDVSHVRGRDRTVAQVFQFPVFYDGLTLLQNLCFPLTSHGASKADAQKRACEIAERLQIAHLLQEAPARLPLFEKQLLAIGRALVRPNLALVLLDEPLTAVEPKVKWRLRALLREIQEDSHVTMLYVTHDQTEALTFADQVSVMHEGRLLQTGSPSELHDAPSHEYVGHFIGSPGMNFLSASVSQGRLWCGQLDLGATVAATDTGYRLGFRADWASLAVASADTSSASSSRANSDDISDASDTPKLAAQVLSQRLTGVQQGQPQAQYQLSVQGETIAVQGAALDADEKPVTLALNQYVLFHRGERVDHAGV